MRITINSGRSGRKLRFRRRRRYRYVRKRYSQRLTAEELYAVKVAISRYMSRRRRRRAVMYNVNDDDVPLGLFGDQPAVPVPAVPVPDDQEMKEAQHYIPAKESE